MKQYKITRSVNIFKEPCVSYRYKYSCPFCKTEVISYGYDENILSFRCSQCSNKIKVGKLIIKNKGERL